MLFAGENTSYISPMTRKNESLILKMRKFLAGFIEKLMIPGMTLYSKMRLFVVIVSNSKPFTLETIDYRIAYIVQSNRVETQMSSQSKQSWTAERNIPTHIR